MIAFPEAKKVAGMLAAIGEPTRMRILYRLAQGPYNVGQLADLLGVPMVNMSHHLGVMRQAGLLEDEKDGRRVVYRVRDDIHTPGGADGTLATLAVGVYRLIIKRGASGPAAGKVRRKAAGKAPRKAKAAD